MARDNKKLETCYYCETVFTTLRSAMGDHFPVPRRNGGLDVVPCCKTCHEAKDSISLYQWNNEMLLDVVRDFPKLSKNTRLFLAKWLSCVTDLRPEPEPTREGDFDD
jgi:hypothetical protein